MKKVNIAAVIAVSCVMLSGCATTGTDPASIDDVMPYVRPGSSVVCSVVLQNAVSSADRAEKAKIINAISNAVATLASGKVPSVDDIRKAIASVAPDKAHWATLSSSIASVYQTAYVKYIKGDAAKAAEVLEQISLGCADATSPYL